PLLFSPCPRPPAPHTLSLHDALPISSAPPASPAAGWIQMLSNGPSRSRRPLATQLSATPPASTRFFKPVSRWAWRRGAQLRRQRDRKSTRLNSSHGSISYDVFCLKKK